MSPLAPMIFTGSGRSAKNSASPGSISTLAKVLCGASFEATSVSAWYISPPTGSGR